MFLELVIRSHQQLKRYDIEVLLYEAPCSLTPEAAMYDRSARSFCARNGQVRSGR